MEKIEQKLKDIPEVHMTDSERNLMRTNVIKFLNNHIPENIQDVRYKVKSPYVFHNILKVGGIVFASFVLIFTGGGLSYQANDALPGDFLYSLKVNTIEEVRGAFIKSPEEKLLYNQARVAKRIDEVITLAEEGNLTIEKGEKVEKALDSHISEIEEAAKKLKEKSPQEFKDATENLTPIIEQHKNDLEEINEKAEISSLSLKKEQVVDGAEKEDVTISTEAKSNINKESKERTISVGIKLENKTNTTKSSTLDIEKKKEESKKAVDSIIAKIEKETDSIKAITIDPTDISVQVKSTSIKDIGVESEIENPLEKATIQ